MNKQKKILLTSLPDEHSIIDWRSPAYFARNDRVANYDPSNYVPLGILSLATNLGQTNNEVVILDPQGKGMTIDETIQRIEQERPDILGISSNTMRVYAMKEILQKSSAPYKAVGGPHIDNYAQLTLEQGADVVFVGRTADFEFRDAVETMPKGIVKCATNYKDTKYPNRMLIDYASYFPKRFTFFETKNRLHLISGLGCPNKCFFCTPHPGGMQRRHPKDLVDEIEHLYSLGSRSVHFLDENFNVSERYLNEVLDEKERRGLDDLELSGRGQTRMSLELARKLRKHGLSRIHVGIESLDDDVLKYYKKGFNVRQIQEFCETIAEAGIDILGHFVLGSPVETEKYLATLPSKIKSLGIKYPHFQILSPTPDTEYYFSLLKDGIYERDYWAEYIRDPVQDFELPYPYGNEKLTRLIQYIEEVEKDHRLEGNSEIII